MGNRLLDSGVCAVPLGLKCMLRRIDRFRGHPGSRLLDRIIHEYALSELEEVTWHLFKVTQMIPDNIFAYSGADPTIRYLCEGVNQTTLAKIGVERIYVTVLSQSVKVEKHEFGEIDYEVTQFMCGVIGTEEVLQKIEELLKLPRRSLDNSNSDESRVASC